MFKKALVGVFGVVFVLSTLTSVGAADSVFSDVYDGDDSAVAIEFLRDHEIINGYPDGTFQPERALNRAELTKIVIESLGLDLVDTEDCFPDIEADDWFAKYVCTAKNLGWIKGYNDGSFKPEQTINHAEAMKIIALASEWKLEGEGFSPEEGTRFQDMDLSQWYAEYVLIAEEFNFLPFGSRFEPAADMTRRDFAEIYYRLVYSQEQGLEVFVEPETSVSQELSETNEDDDLVDEISLGKTVESKGTTFEVDTFEDLVLNDPFPSVYLENEVYYFEGVLDEAVGELYVVKYLKGDKSTTETFRFPLDSKEFSVPVHFMDSGDFYIGIAPKGNAEVVIAEVEVGRILTEALELEAPADLGNIAVNFESDNSEISFTKNSNLKKFELSQGSKKVEYFSRQNLDRLALNYVDFEGFSEGQIELKSRVAQFNSDFTQRSAWSGTNSVNFAVVEHHYSEVDPDITNLNLPDFYTLNSSVSILGVAGKESLTKVLSVIRPDGSVDEVSVANDIASGQSFAFSYDKLNVAGTYFLEVNKNTGIAAINHPIYESGKIPLLPDYFDLNPLRYSDAPFTEESDKTLLLSLINQERAKYGLSQLRLDSELNVLAKDHAKDMIENNYFAHVNLSGDSPNDRATQAGFEMYVGENLANSTSTEYSHYALMRSAIHRDNILQKEWTRVGLGIQVNESGQYYVVQEFSTDETYYYNELVNYVENNSDTFLQSDLVSSAESWNNLMLAENIFSTSFEGQSVGDSLDDLSYSDYRILILSGLGLEKFKESLLEDKSWDNFGLSLGYDLDDNQTIKLTVIFARD